MTGPCPWVPLAWRSTGSSSSTRSIICSTRTPPGGSTAAAATRRKSAVSPTSIPSAKSPWSDDGQFHSPLIGFAFDGFPVFGPYEAPGILAKDSATNPLNEFNIHSDDARGTHYHVTPGKFPHILGGYWGTRDEKTDPQGLREGEDLDWDRDRTRRTLPQRRFPASAIP